MTEPDSVGEPQGEWVKLQRVIELCADCGHDKELHLFNEGPCHWLEKGPCMCEEFQQFVAPATAPVPVSDEAEAEEAWATWAEARAAGGSEGSIYVRHRDGTQFHAGFIAGFCACRLAGAGAQVTEAAVLAARDALFNDGDNLTRWCGVCSGEMCDDCIAIRDDAARAALSAALPHMGTGQAEADLTPAEIARLAQSVETDEGTGDIRAVVYAVESLLAARTAGQAEADLRARISALADEWERHAKAAPLHRMKLPPWAYSKLDRAKELRDLLDRPAAAETKGET